MKKREPVIPFNNGRYRICRSSSTKHVRQRSTSDDLKQLYLTAYKPSKRSHFEDKGTKELENLQALRRRIHNLKPSRLPSHKNSLYSHLVNENELGNLVRVSHDKLLRSSVLKKKKALSAQKSEISDLPSLNESVNNGRRLFHKEVKAARSFANFFKAGTKETDAILSKPRVSPRVSEDQPLYRQIRSRLKKGTLHEVELDDRKVIVNILDPPLPTLQSQLNTEISELGRPTRTLPEDETNDKGYWFHEYEENFLSVLELCRLFVTNFNFCIKVMKGKRTSLLRILHICYTKMGPGPFNIQQYIFIRDTKERNAKPIKSNHFNKGYVLAMLYKGEHTFNRIIEIFSELDNEMMLENNNLLDEIKQRWDLTLKCSAPHIQELIRFVDHLSGTVLDLKRIGISKFKEIADFLMSNIDQWGHREMLKITKLQEQRGRTIEKTYGYLSQVPDHNSDKVSIVKHIEFTEQKSDFLIDIAPDKREINSQNRLLLSYLRNKLEMKRQQEVKMITLKNENHQARGIIGVVDYK